MVSATDAKNHARELLGGIPGIGGIGLSWTEDGTQCIVVMIMEDMSKGLLERIPKSIDGVPVCVQMTSKISHHAESASQSASSESRARLIGIGNASSI